MKKLLLPALALLVPAAAAGAWYTLGHTGDPIKNARILLLKGDLRGAQIELRNAVKTNPSSAEAHLRLAQIQLQTSDPVAAEKELKTARELKLDPNVVVPLLAQSYLSQQRFAEVLSEVKVDPAASPADAAKAYVMRAMAQIGMNNDADARASLMEAQRLAPDNQDAALTLARISIIQQDLGAAERQVDRVLALNETRADALVLKGQLLAAKGDQDGALGYLDRAVAAAPSSLGMLLERANQYVVAGQDATARADVNKVLAAEPQNAGAVYLDMVLLVRAGRYADSDLALGKLSGVIQRFPRGLYFQALIKSNLGQTEQAVDAALRYVAQAPTDFDGARLLARVELGAQRPERAAAVLNKAIAAGATTAETLDLLGRAYAIQGKAQLASRTFQEAASLAPSSPDILTRLASTRMQLGDMPGATAALEKALDIQPTQPDTGEALVATALSSGEVEKAQAALDRLRQQNGETEMVGILTGMVKLASMDMEGARAQFAAVAKTFPASEMARVNLGKVLVLLGRKPEAEAVLNGVLKENRADMEALTSLVQSLVQDNKLPEAIQAIQAARAADPGNPVLTAALVDLHIRAKEPGKALDVLQQALESGVQPPILLAARARAQVADGDANGAKASYRQILAGTPLDLETRRALVALALNTNDLDGAEAALHEGLKLSPGNLGMMNTLIFTAQRRSGISGALAMADKLRRDPANLPASSVIKGDTFMAARRYADAAAAFAAELKMNPSSALALRTAGALASAGGQEQAAHELQAWLTQHPDDTDATQMLATFDISAGRNEAAERHLQTVLGKRPNDVIALNNLAWVYQAKGDPRARGLAQRAHLLSPSGETSDTLGWIMTKEGAAADALPLLKEAAQRRPNDRTVKFHLASALSATGQTAAAAQALDAILDDAADFDDRGAARSLRDRIKGR